jgi:PEP-CTERM motif
MSCSKLHPANRFGSGPRTATHPGIVVVRTAPETTVYMRAKAFIWKHFRAEPRLPAAPRLGVNFHRHAVQFCLYLLCCFAFAASVYAGPIGPSNFPGDSTYIDFHNLMGGNCNLCGPSVTNQYSDLGVTFNNPSYPGEDTADTNLTPLIPGSSSPNSLFVFQGGLITDPPAQPFQIQFSVPVTMVGFNFGSTTNAYLELDVYGAGNTLLESLDFLGNPAPIGLAGFAGVQDSTPITEVDVSYHPFSDPSRTFNFSINDLQFEDPIPEPSTFVLLAIGLLGIILVLRCK